jgi:hypothetical protein
MVSASYRTWEDLCSICRLRSELLLDKLGFEPTACNQPFSGLSPVSGTPDPGSAGSKPLGAFMATATGRPTRTFALIFCGTVAALHPATRKGHAHFWPFDGWKRAKKS